MKEFQWVFNTKPNLINYFYMENRQECEKRIEKTYRITEKDYTILKERSINGETLSLYREPRNKRGL